ncbi:MAG: CRISPR-associated endonuclease Cas3'' [Rhodospirillaceae bacterium]
MFYAHSNDGPPDTWEPLGDHLGGVAALAEEFAGMFEAAALGRAAGLLHDAGKYRAAFQARIQDGGPRTDHSAYGAYMAVERYGPVYGSLLAYAVAGHHAGLPDGGDVDGCLGARLRAGREVRDVAPWPDDLLPLPETPTAPPDVLKTMRARPQAMGFTTSMLVRMVFSALTDADFIATERFCNPDKGMARAEDMPTLDALRERLDVHLADLAACSSARQAEGREAEVLRQRAAILDHCRTAADGAPGVFSLTVPTGGGKTLSSLAFALEHARRHGLRRVVYVIPYTSIIEQTAQVFRDALGDLGHAVLEHHSAAPPPREDEPIGPQRLRLAEENWDAPIVVTTSVRFFESLFAARPSACRKLHNMAGSVIILDEAQALPHQHLEPCVAALRELADGYGASVVLCTATQPDFRHGPVFRAGFGEVREIIPDPTALQDVFRRVRVDDAGPLDDDALLYRLRAEAQVLCIVDARRYAADLRTALGGEDTFHLSAAMCPAHRRAVLEEVRARLIAGAPCRLVATQVVEAGVDVDFPVVYRAAAGIDSLTQAAGRWNRNGRLGDGGRFVIFTPRLASSIPDLKLRRELARPILERTDDPLGLDAVTEFFRDLFSVRAGTMDACNILPRMEARKGDMIFPFRSIAEEFHMIGEATRPVIVPWEDEDKSVSAAALVDDLRRRDQFQIPLTRDLTRALQQVSVSVFPNEFARLQAAGALSFAGPDGQFAMLTRAELYHGSVGLLPLTGERSADDNIF